MSCQAELEAARLLLAKLGLSPEDLLQAAGSRPAAPTFAEYIPVVSAAVSDGARRAYGTYWNRVRDQWGHRRIDEPAPSDIQQLAMHIRTHVVARRNARGGRSAAEHLIAALRCLYNRAVADGLIAEADNPARKVAKPRRLPSTRRAPPADRLAEINQVAASTGNDPALDTVLLRLHTETACRRGGGLALRPCDLDTEQCLSLLREKGGAVRWQPVPGRRRPAADAAGCRAATARAGAPARLQPAPPRSAPVAGRYCPARLIQARRRGRAESASRQPGSLSVR